MVIFLDELMYSWYMPSTWGDGISGGFDGNGWGNSHAGYVDGNGHGFSFDHPNEGDTLSSLDWRQL